MKKVQNTDISSYLSLPPVKMHCSMLAEDAIKAAIADYRKKQAAKKGGVPVDAAAAAAKETTKAAAEAN